VDAKLASRRAAGRYDALQLPPALHRFHMRHHNIGQALIHAGPIVFAALPHQSKFSRSSFVQASARFCLGDEEERDVEIALRLDVLAICAVFAFVGAILLGAF